MQTNHQHINYSFEDIEKYFQGKMNAAEMHELEKAALQDAFLADALEGYKNASMQQSQQDLEEVRNKILNKKEETKIVPLIPFKKWIWAAASVVGIILIGSLFWLNNKSTQSNNLVVAKNAVLPKSNKDSVLIAPQQKIVDSSTKMAANISKENKTVQQKNSTAINYHQPTVINNNDEAYITQKAPSLDSLTLSLNETSATNAETKLSVVQSAEFKQKNSAPPTNLSAPLEGKVAGVAVSGWENNKSIKIRGNKTLDKSKDPLVVINGIPSSQSFSDINTNDIVSVKILKDSAASKIYGSTAANGVILVTTKSKNNFNGRVVDVKGNPVSNASIHFGNRIGTETNNDGYFSLTNTGNDSILNSTVAAIGYEQTHQKLVANQTNNIVLNEATAALNEVVVIGYGTVKRKNVTGSVASINFAKPNMAMPESGWDNLKRHIINELKKENLLAGINIHGTYNFKYGLDKNNHLRKIKIISSPDKKINPYFIKALQSEHQWRQPEKSLKKYKATITL